MKARKKIPTPAAQRMAAYRKRMRAQGMRLVQMWQPDTRLESVRADIQRQCLALARSDPGGDEIMEFIERAYEWPDP